jgi:hypothetical protein
MCGKTFPTYIPRGYDYREITVTCGSTSPDGSPWLCDRCEREHVGRDWRREAIEAGETWGDEDY